MLPLIQCQCLGISFGPKTVFSDLCLSIFKGERLGLVGPNGSGKSTLLKMLAGKASPDHGTITRSEGLNMGYLPQEIALESEPSITVGQYLSQCGCLQPSLRLALETCEMKMAAENLCLKDQEELLADYGQLQEAFEQSGGYTTESRWNEILAGLKMTGIDYARLLQTLSGGELARLTLATLAIKEPDLLLLDEPTNHLDLPSLLWLEDYLKTYTKGVLIVSHDREFLDRTVAAIVEISDSGRGISRCGGNYSSYIGEKERQWEIAWQAYHNSKREIRQLKQELKECSFATKRSGRKRDSNKMSYDHKGEKHQKSKSRIIRQKHDRLESLLSNHSAAPTRRTVVGIRFDADPLHAQAAIVIENLSLSVEGKILLNGMNATLSPGDRVCITGPNGCGKTTLLRAIAGEAPIAAGSIQCAETAKFTFLTQHATEFDLKKSVLEIYADGQEKEESFLRAELAKYGLFTNNLVHLPARNLSRGQKQKLQIALAIASRANVLLLDEPTNHLDFESMEKLENALLSFSGIVIAATHDRWFTQKIATQVWQINQCEVA